MKTHHFGNLGLAAVRYALVVAFLAGPGSSFGQSSTTSISFQGVLNGANGLPLANGSYDLTFRFYTNATTASALGVTNVNNVIGSNGVASTAIPVEPAWFDGQTRFLGISVNGDAELAPRVMVTAVPYAIGFSGSQLTVRGAAASMRLENTSEPSASPNTYWGIDTAGWDRNGSFSLWRRVNGDIPYPLIHSDSEGRIVAIGPSIPELGSAYLRSYRFQVCGDRDAAIRLVAYAAPGGGWWSIDPNAFDEGYFQILRWNDSTSPVSMLSIDRGGNVGIGTRSAQTRLDVNGTTRTRILQITGGSDLAEPFDVTAPSADTPIVPGMVMVIDRERDGKLTPCARAYDTAVAGILSGANGLQPGMVMKAEGQPQAEGEHPLAMTGRVWCLADAAYGAIQRSDRLTTSCTLGHAMKAADEARAPGAVIGKAMTELRQGQGLVLVLVNLQ